MDCNTRSVTFSLALVLAATGAAAIAGDLDPPAGPIGPTMKTLDEVEPRVAINATNTPGDAGSLFRIAQPGSYYLTDNITGVVGKHGIEIAANGVTVDLNGFDLVGVPGMGPADGVIATTAVLRNIAVVNGSIRNWGDEGVDLGAFEAKNCRIEGVLLSGNAGNGIVVYSGATITHCSAYQNGSAGFVAVTGCTFTNCSAYLNTGNGINAGSGGTVTNCSAYQNGGSGLVAGVGATVVNCSTNSNTSSGISVSNGCTVADCSARSNTLDGIFCNTGCIIRGNTCSSNGDLAGDGAGIHVFGGDNRIEGNNCTQADRGIDVDSAGNVIVKNTCAGNTTNYAIVADNRYGAIVNITASGTAAVSGNSAASTLASTDPWANFAY